MNGNCKYGDKCRYSHDDPGATGRSPRAKGRGKGKPSAPATPRTPRGRRVICPHWKKGTCKFGDDCRARHDRNSTPKHWKSRKSPRKGSRSVSTVRSSQISSVRSNTPRGSKRTPRTITKMKTEKKTAVKTFKKRFKARAGRKRPRRKTKQGSYDVCSSVFAGVSEVNSSDPTSESVDDPEGPPPLVSSEDEGPPRQRPQEEPQRGRPPAPRARNGFGGLMKTAMLFAMMCANATADVSLACCPVIPGMRSCFLGTRTHDIDQRVRFNSGFDKH